MRGGAALGFPGGGGGLVLPLKRQHGGSRVVC